MTGRSAGASDWTAGLAKAGLVVRDGCGDPEGFIPAAVTGQLASVMPEDVSDSAWADIDDPELHRKANADWYRLAVAEGLFRAEDARFFLADDSSWICVELRPEWDVMGVGAAGPLGSAHCRPEFRMLSLDGSVLLGATTSQSSIETIVVKEPHRSQVLRRFAAWVAESDSGLRGPRERAAARRWLDGHPVSEA
ncbi:hypothetical protein [Streptomyces sp. ME18-1-4]|uniref:hypothetical protein n=1 Tax=Streptomyces sp. ME18-1-4 TaxID=3028685 RepID=UPI0029A3B627|nr:hypothetical protein [Streptomyces sp. ME18-1-4]MDX3244809.1 hypothetical protein [Streptomyces sp. ME18-1-4]